MRIDSRDASIRVLYSVGLAALVLRLLFFVAAAREPTRFMIESDSGEYWRLALNLAAGRGFSQAEAPPYAPDVRRTPVYPAFVAAAAKLSGGSVEAAILLGIAASVATVLLVVKLTTRLFGPEAGVWAGLCLALDLTSAAYANQLLTEAIFTLLLMASVGVLTRRGGSDVLAAVESGVLSGLAALCRPIALLASLALWPAAMWRARRRSLFVLLVAVAASALLIAGWAWRNAQVAGVTTVSSIAAMNAYFHRAASVQAYLTHQRVEDVRADWEREFGERAASWTEIEKIAWLSAHGGALMLDHPAVYLLVWSRGVVHMLQPDRVVLPRLLGLDANGASWRVVYWLAWIQLVGLYLFALRGIAISLRSNVLATTVPLALLAYFIVISGPEMYSRFRVPFMPAVCMLAGVGMSGGRANGQGGSASYGG